MSRRWSLRPSGARKSPNRKGTDVGGHSSDDDSVDFDQDPESPQVEGHDYIEHDDGEIDADEGY